MVEEATSPHLQRIAAAMGTIATLAGNKTLIWEELIEWCESVARAAAALQSGLVLLYVRDTDDAAGAAYLVNGDPVLFKLVSDDGDEEVIEIRHLRTDRCIQTLSTSTTVGAIEGVNVRTIPVEALGGAIIRPSRVMETAASVWISYVHALARLENPREIDLLELDRQRDLALKCVAF